MIEPPSFRSGKPFCTVNSAPFTLMLNSLSKCSSETLPKGTNSPTPALAKIISIRPFTLPTVSYRRSRSASFATSPRTPVTLLPIAVTASSSSFFRRPVTKTYAPSLTKSCAVANPMPSVPPVITATFPCNLPTALLLLIPALLLSDQRPSSPEVRQQAKLPRTELDGSKLRRIRKIAYQHEQQARDLVMAGFLTPDRLSLKRPSALQKQA